MSEKDLKKRKVMDNLVSGLISGDADRPQQPSEDSGSPEKPKTKGRRGRPARGQEWEAAYIVVNREKYDKIRMVAGLSHKKIKDVIDIALGDFIKKYEKTYGVIRIHRKVDLDVLNDD